MYETNAAARDFVEVSPEMTLLTGRGALGDAPLPPAPIAISFTSDANTPALTFDLAPTRPSLERNVDLTLVVQRSAYERLCGRTSDLGAFHQPSALRTIVRAIRDTPLTGETQKVYRLGKSIELLCETIRLLGDDELVALDSEGVLSLEDARRIVAARRMIDERWGEKLTLERIARACGLNRAKLTRGFRDMFNCTIAEAIAERRLGHASEMLRTTSLPVSSIGYENGYLNNASFARAFARRFGVSPTDFRQAAA